jgi:hypothetical protein
MKALMINWTKVGRIINRQIGELIFNTTFWHGAEGCNNRMLLPNLKRYKQLITIKIILNVDLH